MKQFILYTLTVVIWGSTWFAIKMQLDQVDPMVSVAYRFTLAATLLLAGCKLARLPLRFSKEDHLFMALQGVFLFSLNYLLFYLAEQCMASGLVAIIFSTILLMNMVNGAIFLKTPMDPKVLIGGLLGFLGIGLVFQPEITGAEFSSHTLKGILLGLGATYLASLGNILSARNQRHHLPVMQSNGFGMAYGAFLMLAFSFLSGKEFILPVDIKYYGALFYLAAFGSIVAFWCYLTLLGTIGADRAAYSTLLSPLVALFISTVLEGYQWSISGLLGVVFIMAGNLMMLRRKKQLTQKPVTDSRVSRNNQTQATIIGGSPVVSVKNEA